MTTRGTNAFSLVEVVIAMGIFTFAITALLGLIPVGLKSVRSVSNEGNAVHVASSIFGLWQVMPTNVATPALSIPDVFTNLATVGAAKTTTTYYFNSFGVQVANSDTASMAMDYTATSLGAAVPGGWEVELKFRWPARAASSASGIQTRTFKEVFLR